MGEEPCISTTLVCDPCCTQNEPGRPAIRPPLIVHVLPKPAVTIARNRGFQAHSVCENSHYRLPTSLLGQVSYSPLVICFIKDRGLLLVILPRMWGNIWAPTRSLLSCSMTAVGEVVEISPQAWQLGATVTRKCSGVVEGGAISSGTLWLAQYSSPELC